MTIKIKKIQGKISKLLEEGTDEEVLTVFASLLSRVQISGELYKDLEDDEIYVGHSVSIVCGDRIIESEVKEFSWPLQLMPIPEAFEGKLN